MTESRTEPTEGQLYHKRSLQRSTITTLISQAKAVILNAGRTDEEISAITDRLNYESDQLRNIDRNIEPFLTGAHAEQEFMDTFEFRDIFVTWQSILRQAMQCPRSELWGACLRYGRVASQFLARTKSCNFNCPSDASRVNTLQASSHCMNASTGIEDSTDNTEMHRKRRQLPFNLNWELKVCLERKVHILTLCFAWRDKPTENIIRQRVTPQPKLETLQLTTCLQRSYGFHLT